MTTMIAITFAKMGRSMKNFDILTLPLAGR